MKQSLEKSKSFKTDRLGTSLYIESLIARSQNDPDALNRAEIIFREISVLPSPMKEEILIRLIVSNIEETY